MKADCVSYLKQHKGVFVTASGTGFYAQCFPSATVHLGFSATAMHWLVERLIDKKNIFEKEQLKL